MKRALILILLLLSTLVTAEEVDSKDEALQKIRRQIVTMKNSCQFADSIEYLTKLREENDGYTAQFFLFYYSLQRGNFKMAKELERLLRDHCKNICRNIGENKYLVAACEACQERVDSREILYKFYQEKDYPSVSEIEPEITSGPVLNEAIILSAIIVNNRERMKYCEKENHESYYCMLSNYIQGKAPKEQEESPNALKRQLRRYVEGEITRPEMDEVIRGCLKDLPAYKEIMLEVIDMVEKDAEKD